MMAKAIVAEIMARQAVSFVLGAATALTLVLLVQYRAPAEGLSYAWTHGQISGRRLPDEQYHRRNDTAHTVHHAPSVAVAGEVHHLHQADTTLKVNSSFATATTHAAVVPSDLLSIKQRAPRRGCGGGGGVPGTGGGGVAGGDGRPHRDHHVREPSLGSARLAAGPLPGELPHRRRHGPAPAARPGGDHGPGRPRALPGRAPPLLPARHPRHQPRLLRPRRVAGSGVEQAEAAAPDPGARLRLPLHGRRRDVAARPVQARDGLRRHDHLLRQLLRGPRQHRQPAQHRLLPHETEPADDRHDEAVARVQGKLPGHERAAGVQRDQGAAGGGARGPAAVPGSGAHGRVL